jgi:hypothetical protein
MLCSLRHRHPVRRAVRARPVARNGYDDPAIAKDEMIGILVFDTALVQTLIPAGVAAFAKDA